MMILNVGGVCFRADLFSTATPSAVIPADPAFNRETQAAGSWVTLTDGNTILVPGVPPEEVGRQVIELVEGRPIPTPETT